MSCGGSTAHEIAPPPAALVERCAPPSALPDRALGPRDLGFVARDRAAHLTCRDRHDALAQWAEQLTGPR